MRPEMKKKFTGLAAGLLSAAMLVQPVLAADNRTMPTIPDGWTNPFSDVADDGWYTPFVSNLSSNGIINGYDDGRFGIGDQCQAGQVVLMVLKAADYGEMKPGKGEHYAQGYVDYAMSQGWLKQEWMPETLDGEANRFLIARLVGNVLGLGESKNKSPFADIDDPAITAVCEAGIIDGMTTEEGLCFKPDDTLTREQLSVIVYRVLEFVENHSYVIKFHGRNVRIYDSVPAFSYDHDAFVKDGQKMTYTGDEVNASWGIDVSKYQGTVDWEKVKEAGAEFAIVRAGYRGYGKSGKIVEDPTYRQNMEGAREAGLQTGVYFFSQAITVDEAIEEANYVLDLIKDYKIDAPVVFDWETVSDRDARTNGLSKEVLSAAANAFCETIADAGYDPMVYVNLSAAYLHYDMRELVRWPIWLAEYDKKTPSFRYDFDMWQYTSNGKMDGINGRVDMNIWMRPTKA